MKIIVCVKNASVVDEDFEIEADGISVDKDFLDFVLNEWDGFAMEEALRIKEARDDETETIAVTVGSENSDAALRKCMAMGADRAIRVNGSGLQEPISIARALSEIAVREHPDLILCGVQSSDSTNSATGPALAGFLDWPVATVVTRVALDTNQNQLAIERELGAGISEAAEIDLPCVLTVQTGINEPRYSTLRAIKRAERLEIELSSPADGFVDACRIEQLRVPEKKNTAEMLAGDAAAVALRISEIIKGALT